MDSSSLVTAYLNKCIFSVAIGNNDNLNNYFMPQRRIYNQEQYATVLVQQYLNNYWLARIFLICICIFFFFLVQSEHGCSFS